MGLGAVSAVPTWQPNTAYLVTARVAPSVANGFLFRAMLAGTSAGTEPVWPSASPWTVVDGGVTWSATQPFRELVTAGMVSTLQTFRTANPTLLKGVASARPKSFGNFDLPGAYIGGRDEAVFHDQSIRRRIMAPQIIVVDRVPDNIEAQARMDALIDGLQDVLTDGYHSASGFSLTQQTAVNEIDLADGGTNYVGNAITISALVAEGRD